MAYQPFSKGMWTQDRLLTKAPRSCIGQEFAYMEVKLIIAMTLRKFDFKSMYPGIPFQIYAFTNKPVDGMPMQVSLVK